MEGSESAISAFILFETSVSSPGGDPSMKEETIAADMVGVVVWISVDSWNEDVVCEKLSSTGVASCCGPGVWRV